MSRHPSQAIVEIEVRERNRLNAEARRIEAETGTTEEQWRAPLRQLLAHVKAGGSIIDAPVTWPTHG